MGHRVWFGRYHQHTAGLSNFPMLTCLSMSLYRTVAEHVTKRIQVHPTLQTLNIYSRHEHRIPSRTSAPPLRIAASEGRPERSSGSPQRLDLVAARTVVFFTDGSFSDLTCNSTLGPRTCNGREVKI